MSSWRNCCLGWWQGQKLYVTHSGDHDNGWDHGGDHDDGGDLDDGVDHGEGPENDN